MKAKILTWICAVFVLASFAFAVLPGDLTFTATPSSTSIGLPFVVKLVCSSGNPMNPFSVYDNATVSLPGGITNTSDPLFIDLTNPPAGTCSGNICTWSLNSSAAAAYTINITVEEPNSVYTGNASVTINDPAGNPAIVIDIPDIADYRLVGTIYPIQINFTNNGNGNASSISGFFNIDKAAISPNSISISNIENGTSALVDFNITPSAGGNASLLANLSSYRKADNTLISAGDADFNATGDIDWFYVNSNPALDLSSITQINVIQGEYNDSINISTYVTDSDTTKANLNWHFISSEPAYVSASIDAINHMLNITAGDWTGTAILTVYVNDSYYQDSDTVNIVVSANCTESWSCNSWGECQSDGTQACSGWTDATGCGTDYTGSNTQGCTYIPPADDTPPPTNTGGGLPPTPIMPSRSFAWESLSSGSIAVMKITDSKISISEIEIKILNDLTNAEINVEEVTTPESVGLPKGVVYQFLLFTKNNIEDSDIESADIDFTVSKKWLLDNDVDKEDIVLMRYNNDKWNELAAEITDYDTTDVYFKATTPGFSYFAIGKSSETAEDTEEVAEEAEESTEIADEEETQQTTDEITGAVTQETEETADWIMPYWLKYIIYAIAGIIVLNLIIYLIARKKKAKKPKGKGSFRKAWNKSVEFFMAEDEDIIPLGKLRKKKK